MMTRPVKARRAWLWVHLCAILGFLQILRAIRVLQLPDGVTAILTLPAHLDFVLQSAWALMLLAMSLTLVRNSAHTLGYAYALLTAYGLFHLIRLAVFAQADYDRARLPVLFILYLVLLIAPLLAYVNQRRMK